MEKNIEKMLSIHLTDLCNNKCIFCIVDAPSQVENKVSRERILSFLEEHRDQGYEAVNLHGGESTTRPDFFEILQKIKECGYPRIILQTNGRKFSKMEYAEKVVGLGVTKFVISIHGSTPGIHDIITRTPGSLSHAVKGIKNLETLAAHVRTNSVMSKLNGRDFPAIMKLLLKLNVDHINISAIHTSGAALKNFDKVVPKYSHIYPYLKESLDLVTGAGIPLTLEGFPSCMIPGMEQYVINWETQKFKMLFRDFVLDDYESYMDRTMRIHGAPCKDCHQKEGACGGVYKEYISLLGWEEFGYKTGRGVKDETDE